MAKHRITVETLFDTGATERVIIECESIYLVAEMLDEWITTKVDPNATIEREGGGEEEMIIAKLAPNEVGTLSDALRQAKAIGLEVYIAYNPTENSFKFKMGTSVWSPPMGNSEL